MGLYSDSPATVSVYTRSSDTRDRVDSQLRHVARGMYLHPSPWGAHIVYTILSDGKLYPAWYVDIFVVPSFFSVASPAVALGRLAIYHNLLCSNSSFLVV